MLLDNQHFFDERGKFAIGNYTVVFVSLLTKHYIRFFNKKNFYRKMSLKNPKTLRKSPDSKARAAIFKNADFP